MSLYRLKPHFQGLLRPVVRRLAAKGVTANQVTLAGMVGSLVVGALVLAGSDQRVVFLAIPVWLFLRMSLNAIDGMLAREHGQRSRLGAYLNEISDVVSDAALYLPFAVIAPFTPALMGLVIFLSVLTELAGVLGTSIGGSRRYDGPMGKSDRALIFALLGLAVTFVPALPDWTIWIMVTVAFLNAITIATRIRAGIREAEMPSHP